MDLMAIMEVTRVYFDNELYGIFIMDLWPVYLKD
jgi:hypothetical protein